MIRNTLSYRFGTFMGGIALLAIIGIQIFFKFAELHIEQFYMVRGAFGLIIMSSLFIIALLSIKIGAALIIIDCIFHKKYTPRKKASTLQVVIECTLINLYIICIAPICAKLIQHIFGG